MSFSIMNDPFDIFFTSCGSVGPNVNIGHNNREIMLQVSLPGFSRSDIDVEVVAGRLTVKAKASKINEEYEYTTREIRFADYSKSWSLPRSANTEAAEAAYDAGILTVKIPYLQASKDTARKIELR